MRTRHTLIALTAGALLSPAARAQFKVPWSSIDSGATAQAMAGGGFSLVGTIGQHDARPVGEIASGASRSLSGGFWQPPLVGLDCLADLAPPFGVLDLSDLIAFVEAFQLALPSADVAPPFGIWDLSDITTYVDAFLAGCP